jgi:hypothetical protein
MSSTSIELESVPLKADFRLKRESLPSNIEETFKSMTIGQSFFLETNDPDHTTRKSAALRSRAVRFQEENPDFMFSIRKESKDGKSGVRFYRVDFNEDN